MNMPCDEAVLTVRSLLATLLETSAVVRTECASGRPITPDAIQAINIQLKSAALRIRGNRPVNHPMLWSDLKYLMLATMRACASILDAPMEEEDNQ